MQCQLPNRPDSPMPEVYSYSCRMSRNASFKSNREPLLNLDGEVKVGSSKSDQVRKRLTMRTNRTYPNANFGQTEYTAMRPETSTRAVAKTQRAWKKHACTIL